MSEVSKVLRGSLNKNRKKEMESLMRSNSLKKGSLHTLGRTNMSKKATKVLGGLPSSSCQCVSTCSCREASTAYPPRARAGLFDPRNFDQAWPEPSSNPLIPYNWGDSARENEKKWLIPTPSQGLSGSPQIKVPLDIKEKLLGLFDSFKKKNEAYGANNKQVKFVSNFGADRSYFEAPMVSNLGPKEAFEQVSGTDSTTLGFIPVTIDGEGYFYVRFGGPEIISKLGARGFSQTTSTDFMGQPSQTTLNYQFEDAIEREYILSSQELPANAFDLRKAAADEIGYVYPMRIKSPARVTDSAEFQFFHSGQYRPLSVGKTGQEFVRYILNKTFKLMEGLNHKGTSTIGLAKDIMIMGRERPDVLAENLLSAFAGLISTDLKVSLNQKLYTSSTVDKFPSGAGQRPYDAEAFRALLGNVKRTSPITTADINQIIDRTALKVANSIGPDNSLLKAYSEAVAEMFEFYNDANPYQRDYSADKAEDSTETTKAEKEKDEGFSGLQLAGFGLGVGALTALLILSRPIKEDRFN